MKQILLIVFLALWQTQPKVEGCVSCHGMIEPMHKYGPTETLDKLKDGKDAVGLTCTGCHGGNPASKIKDEAHVRSRFSRNAKMLWNRESWEFVRFVNPGDLRVAATTCGSSSCHESEPRNVSRSMMTHGAMLWGAALYNNGSFPLKDPMFGESYSEDGTPQVLWANTDEKQCREKGYLAHLDPIPRWEISQPGNVLRVFERGGKRRLEVGLPDKEEEPGKPDKGLSPRGFGTANRTDPVFLGL